MDTTTYDSNYTKEICPLVDRIIDNGDCLISQLVSEEELKPSVLDESFRQKKNWREICLSCKHHEST